MTRPGGVEAPALAVLQSRRLADDYSMTSTASRTYSCSHGHAVAAPTPLAACPAYVLGSPCTGQLTRTGAGSRSERTTLVAA